MLAKLGLLAAATASVLTLSTTALADETTTSSTDTSIDAALGETTSEAPATEPTEPVTTPPFGPAETPGETPRRGTQVQLAPPPPPPTTQAPWDPFRLPANSGSGRRAVYSKSQQTVWAIDGNNQIIKAHRVSGKQAPFDPRPGTYQVFSRSRYTYSINNPSITWGYMVRFAHGAQGGNIGFHEIPFQYGSPVQSWSQLGQPLSGGCVRQALPDAIWMWNWAQIGTQVVVLP